MYSREELKQLKKEFWEGFGQYAAELPELAHKKSKFMLYDTKMKHVELKFDANREGAFVILELNHKQKEERQLMYSHFLNYKVIMEQEFPEGLTWCAHYMRETGVVVSRIYDSKFGIDIHNRHHWPQFYTFMAAKMIKLEQAFREVKETLR